MQNIHLRKTNDFRMIGRSNTECIDGANAQITVKKNRPIVIQQKLSKIIWYTRLQCNLTFSKALRFYSWFQMMNMLLKTTENGIDF